MADSPFKYRPYLATDEVDAGVLRVTKVVASEIVSRGCIYEVWTTCDIGTLEPRALLQKPAAVMVVRDDGTLVRRLSGVVTRATERGTTIEGRQQIRIVIEDPLALLRYSSDYRIYQELTTKEIVESVFSDSGLPAGEWRTRAAARKRIACTQYGETMRAFVDRLLEEDGISWFIEQTDEAPKVVFCDDPNGWSETPVTKAVPYRHGAGLNPTEALDSMELRARVRPAKVTLRDHDFEKPTLDLESVSEASDVLGRDHYEYPGRYFEPGEGKARAKSILDAHVAEASAATVRGHVFRLAAGHLFDLEESVSSDGSYVVIAVQHEWEMPDDGSFRMDTVATVLPESTRYAPPCTTPRPRALGDLAYITTPSGEEIHTDKHGRVKVQFHWDRYGKQDDKSSGWVRVSQMHTSGSVVIPRRRWEVMLEFEDGNPDRPVVVGRLYNGAAPPTDPLPDGSTNSVLLSYSTPGGSGHNEIRMNDSGGDEVVNVHAQKDLNLVVANNKEEKVGKAADVAVAVDESIKVGANETSKVGAKDQVSVGGSQTYQVGAARTKTISKDENIEVKGSRTTTIAASHTTMTPKSITLNTKGNLTETVGGTNLEVAGMGVAMAVAGSAAITVGGAKVEAVAAGKTDLNVGAKASTIGGALLNVTPADVSMATGNSKTTTVGGAWMANAGGDAEISSKAAIDILVGGAIAMNAAAKIVLKVGGSNVTISAGKVVLESKEVKLTATGPAAELAPMVGSK